MSVAGSNPVIPTEIMCLSQQLIHQTYKVIIRVKNDYLNKNIFYGLQDLNTGFDAEPVKYFSESDFQIILERAEELGLGIYGIEPWRDGEFYDVLTHEDYQTSPTDSNWYKEAFRTFKNQEGNLLYAATFDVHKNLKM